MIFDLYIIFVNCIHFIVFDVLIFVVSNLFLFLLLLLFSLAILVLLISVLQPYTSLLLLTL